jgi:hypothetical protein
LNSDIVGGFGCFSVTFCQHLILQAAGKGFYSFLLLVLLQKDLAYTLLYAKELQFKDKRRIRFDVVAHSPLTVKNFGREGGEKNRGGIAPSPMENFFQLAT